MISIESPGRRLIKIGIIVNPMSGRDVRRLAARASISTHHDKQLQITRLALGALEQGVEEIVLVDEPFRIGRRAVENLPEKSRFSFIASPVTHSARDTIEIARQMKDQQCQVIIVMGGDGTNRIVARTWPDAFLLPLSTGTNNVFPRLVEPSVAGAAAGLVATGKVNPESLFRRCKVIQIRAESFNDIALVDAVMLKGDSLGSLLPFDAGRISDLILAISQPASVGASPIGGYFMPCLEDDDFAVQVRCDTESPAYTSRVPISPGLYQDIGISTIRKIELEENITLHGPGILAFDGDRELELDKGASAVLSVARQGPWVLDSNRIMMEAASKGLFVNKSAACD